MSEKIIAITSCDNELYALTASGKVAFFDKAVGQFVLKSNGEILSFDRANILKHSDELDLVASGKYGKYAPKDEGLPIESDLSLTVLVLAGIGVCLVGLVGWLLIR